MTDKPTSLREDVARGAAAALFGCAALVVGEWVLSVALAQGPVRIVTMVRFLLLDLALVAVGALLFVPLAAVG